MLTLAMIYDIVLILLRSELCPISGSLFSCPRQQVNNAGNSDKTEGMKTNL